MKNVRKSFSCLIYATRSCFALDKSTFCAFLFSKCSTAGLTDVVRKPVGLLSFLWHPNLRGVDINQWLESFLGCLNSATQEKRIPFLIYPDSFIERTLTRFSFLKAVLNFLRGKKNSPESKPTSNVLSLMVVLTSYFVQSTCF